MILGGRATWPYDTAIVIANEKHVYGGCCHNNVYALHAFVREFVADKLAQRISFDPVKSIFEVVYGVFVR